MSPEEDVIALVVEGYHLPAFEVGFGGPEGFEQVRSKEPEGRAEVV